jgi:hypothetical protein
MSKVQQTQIHVQKPVTKKTEQAPKPQRNVAQMFEASETMYPEDVLAAQKQVGNQMVQRALDKNARRQSLTDQQGNLRDDIANQIQKKRGGGSPLPENVQEEATKKLGHSFKDVRIHTDESADKLSRTIHARAFTIGKDIFFKRGVFAPGSSVGRETIIHELTHVVQQSGRSASGTLKLGAPDTTHEKEANWMGKKHAAAISAGAAHGGAVQAQVEEEEIQAQEEEEIQTQEEEELQAQPDTGGVVQRDKDHDERVKMRTELEMDEDLEDDPGNKKLKQISKAQRTKKSMLGAIKDKASSMDLGSKKHLRKLTDVTKSRDEERLETSKSQVRTEKKEHGERVKMRETLGMKDLKGEQLKQVSKAQRTKKGMLGEIKEKAGSMNLGSLQHKDKLADIDKAREAKTKENFMNDPEKGSSSLSKSIATVRGRKEEGAKEKWQATLSDSKASKEDRELAKERLEKFHKGSMKKKDFKAAEAKRKKSLEESAKGGDDEAYKTMKTEQEEKEAGTFKGGFKKAWKEEVADPIKSLPGKIGGGIVKGGKSLGIGALKFAGSGFTEGFKHYFGSGKSEDKDKDDEKDEKKDKKKGEEKDEEKDSGAEKMKEKYAAVLKENKGLKAELAKLKKEED